MHIHMPLIRWISEYPKAVHSSSIPVFPLPPPYTYDHKAPQLRFHSPAVSASMWCGASSWFIRQLQYSMGIVSSSSCRRRFDLIPANANTFSTRLSSAIVLFGISSESQRQLSTSSSPVRFHPEQWPRCYSAVSLKSYFSCPRRREFLYKSTKSVILLIRGQELHFHNNCLALPKIIADGYLCLSAVTFEKCWSVEAYNCTCSHIRSTAVLINSDTEKLEYVGYDP